MGFVQFKRYLTEPKQLIKLVAIIICICVTIYQLYSCVMKLIYPPISTHYKFNLNETIKYPALTFCRRPAYKTDQFPKYGLHENAQLTSIRTFIDFPFDNTTISDFLHTTTYSLEESAIYGFGGSGLSNSVKLASTYFVSRGLCHTFIPMENSATFSIAGGYFLYFRHDAKNVIRDDYGVSTSGFEIFLHDDDQVLFDTDELDNSFLEYIYLETSEDMHVRLDVETFNKISTPNEPCVSEPGYSQSKCQQQCIHRQIAEKTGCILPWLKITDSHNYSECSDYQSVRTLISGFNEMNRSRFLKNCNCEIACNLTIFSSHIITRREADILTKPGSVINLYFTSNLIAQMEEVISYDFNLFVSDVGGSLGFLLGLSVIGIIAVFEEILQMLFDNNQKKETKDSDGKQMVTTIDNKSVTMVFDYFNDCEYYDKKIEKY